MTCDITHYLVNSAANESFNYLNIDWVEIPFTINFIILVILDLFSERCTTLFHIFLMGVTLEWYLEFQIFMTARNLPSVYFIYLISSGNRKLIFGLIATLFVLHFP